MLTYFEKYKTSSCQGDGKMISEKASKMSRMSLEIHNGVKNQRRREDNELVQIIYVLQAW